MGVEGSFIQAEFAAAHSAGEPPVAPLAKEGVDARVLHTLQSAGVRWSDWPETLRASYAQVLEERLYGEQRFLFLLGLITCLLTIGIDSIVNPAMVVEGAVLRVLIVAPITLLGMIAASRGWTRVMAVCIGAAPIGFVGVVVHLSFHLPAQYAATYLTASTLVIGIANIILPFSIRGLAAWNLAFIALVLTVIGFETGGSYEEHHVYIMLLCVIAAATLPLAYRVDLLHRRNFLLNLESEYSARELRGANHQLQILSERDPLTGVLNRRGFERLFDEEIVGVSADPARLSAKGRLVMMMIDIDHFKRFNDTHGHQAGDTCLSAIGTILEEIVLGASGGVGRYGGEEFIAALREDYPGHANEIAEEIRQTIAAILVPVGADDAPCHRSLVTASIGVGLGQHLAENMTFEDASAARENLIEMADAALYSAKRNGRNRVEIVAQSDDQKEERGALRSA